MREREKQRGGLLPPLLPNTAPPPLGALSRSPARAAPGGAGRRQRKRGGSAPSTEKGGGCAPSSRGRGGLCPPPTLAQGPRRAPGRPRPPAQRRRRQNPGWRRPPRGGEGGGCCPLHSGAQGARGPLAAPRPPASRRRRSAHAGAPEEESSPAVVVVGRS